MSFPCNQNFTLSLNLTPWRLAVGKSRYVSRRTYSTCRHLKMLCTPAMISTYGLSGFMACAPSGKGISMFPPVLEADSGLFLSVSVPHIVLMPRHSRHLRLRSSGIRLNILPLRSHDKWAEAYLSVRNSMLLISPNMSRCTMYETFDAGMMSSGTGTRFHCAPAFRLTSTFPNSLPGSV